MECSSAYGKLEQLAAEAKNNKPLQDIFKTGDWEAKKKALEENGFTEEEITTLKADAQLLTDKPKTEAIGYWLW